MFPVIPRDTRQVSKATGPLRNWIERNRQDRAKRAGLRDLMSLDDAILKDIGLQRR